MSFILCCLFLQLLFSGVSSLCSDAQLTASDLDNGEELNSNLENIWQSLQKLHQRLDRQNGSSNGLVQPCPAGFNHSVNAVNKCYAVVLQPMNWVTAQARCRALNPKAHLVVINSPLENQVISEILNEYDCPTGANWFWTSGQRRIFNNCSSSFVWNPNARANQAFSYSSFCLTEPSCAFSGTENCISFAKGCNSNRALSGWQDDLCSQVLCPICEVLKFDKQ